MFDRNVGNGLLDLLAEEGIGTIVFKPLFQGLLTNKYLNGIPKNSRAASESAFLKGEDITEERINKIGKLNEIAKNRGQSLAQMAIAWVLREKSVTSALIGASRVEQLEDNVGALDNLVFSEEELSNIDRILS
jgi:L-glyceraldehyde 3-phosphate reductase